MKTLFASATMCAAGWYVQRFFHLGPARFGFKLVLADFLVTATVACLIFTALAKLMRIEEFDDMLQMAVRRFIKNKPVV